MKNGKNMVIVFLVKQAIHIVHIRKNKPQDLNRPLINQGSDNTRKITINKLILLVFLKNFLIDVQFKQKVNILIIETLQLFNINVFVL